MTSYLDNLSRFSPAIIARGEEYFKQGKVLSISQDKNRVYATVAGTGRRPYSTALYFEKDGVTLQSTACSCPYYYDCKHAVAVLFALEEQRLSVVANNSSLTPDLYLSSLKGWANGGGEGTAAFLVRQLDSLLRFGKDFDKKALLIESYVLLERGMYVKNRSSNYGSEATWRNLDSLYPLAGIDKETFVSDVLGLARKGEEYHAANIFSHFLFNIDFSEVAANYFLSAYKADQNTALGLLDSIGHRLYFATGKNHEFRSILLKERPNLLPDDSFADFLKEEATYNDPRMLFNCLSYYQKNDKRDSFFYDGLKRYYEEIDKEKAGEIIKKMVAGRVYFNNDAAFVYATLPREEGAMLYKHAPLIKYIPVYNDIVFLFYPLLGAFEEKKLSLSFLWPLKDKLNDEQNDYLVALAHAFLSKKRHTASERDECYAAALILAASGDRFALSMVGDKRYETFFSPRYPESKAVSLLVKEKLLTSEESDSLIIMTGDSHVSL